MTNKVENRKLLKPKVLKNTVETKYSNVPMINYSGNKNDSLSGYFNWNYFKKM